MLFNQVAFLTSSTERTGNSAGRKQVVLDLGELAGNGLRQVIAVGGFSQMRCGRNTLHERVQQRPQKARGTQNGKMP